MQKSEIAQNSLLIVLPTKKIPEQLAPLIADHKDFSVRFINGYRNVIGCFNANQLAWTLVQDQNYCAQAFFYLLKTVPKQDILTIKFKNNQIIQLTNGQTFILYTKQRPQLPQKTLSKSQTLQLLEQVTESKQTQKIAINLIKNSFDTYEDFKKIVGQILDKRQKIIVEQQSQIIPSVAENIIIEEQARKVHGQMITKLPKCNQQTGEWDQSQHVEIKLTKA